MRQTKRDNDEIEQILKRAHPVEPSADLRERITGAARQAWKETPAEVPWQIPIRRLAISIAAAILIAACTNYFSALAVASWRSTRPTVARTEIVAFEESPESPYGPFVMHLAEVRRSSMRDRAALLNYTESLRETIERIEQNGVSDTPDPTEGSSRLLPRGPADLYSQASPRQESRSTDA